MSVIEDGVEIQIPDRISITDSPFLRKEILYKTITSSIESCITIHFKMVIEGHSNIDDVRQQIKSYISDLNLLETVVPYKRSEIDKIKNNIKQRVKSFD